MLRICLPACSIGLVVSFASSSALAQDQEPTPPAAYDNEIIVEGKIEEDPEICKRIKPPTASRIARSKKICKLASEWEEERLRMAELNEQRMRNAGDQFRQQSAQTFNNANNPLN